MDLTGKIPFTQEQMQVLAEATEKERCKRDVFYFVTEYVRIEDKDSDLIEMPFHLWEAQRSVLLAFLEERLIQILKARQLGLTWLALAYIAWRMIFKEGYTVTALSKGEKDAEQLPKRLDFILSHLPPWMIAPKDKGWKSTTETITIFHKNNSIFESFASSQNAGRSFTVNLVLLDEWAFQAWARDIWSAAYPSINRPTGGQVIGLSTIERGTLFEDIWNDKDSNFKKIFLGWSSDPRRDQQWYKRTESDLKFANKDVKAEYPATPEEALAIPGGAFFSEFNSTVHLRTPLLMIPDWFRRYRVLDYGLDMLACYFIYIDSQGFGRIYKEVYKSGLVISEAAYVILKASGADVPDNIEKWNILPNEQKQKISRSIKERFDCNYAPPDLFSKSSHTGRSGADVWYDNGISLTKSTNDFEAGCLDVTNWLHPITLKDEQTGREYTTAKLTIDKDAAPNLVHSLLNIQKDKHNPNVYAKQPHNLSHSPDAIRYFCTEIITTPVKPNKPLPDWFVKAKARAKNKNEISVMGV